jgi:subtilisin family serine protease
MLLASFVLSLAAGAAEQRIVVFSQATAPAERVRLAQMSGAQVVRELALINAVVISAPNGQVQSAEIKLKRRAEVVRVDEDPRINWLSDAALRMPDVRAMSKALPISGQAPESTQETPWGITRVNAAAAWNKTRGAGVKVVVIDTGIDRTHPDLADRLAGGWSAVNKENPEDYNDDNGHGSHVAGTIAGIDNEFGVIGVAPKVSLYGVKVLDANGSGTFSDVIAGMEWAVNNKMQVANMSLGASRGNDSLKAAVEAMGKAGVVLVAAAGNSGRAVGFPAAYPDAICVAASNMFDGVAAFSSRGPEVDWIAPGVDVKSTYMAGAYDSLSGTSMATPHVAGLAALAIAAGKTDVRAAFSKASTLIPNVPATEQGAGMIDAAQLVK